MKFFTSTTKLLIRPSTATLPFLLTSGRPGAACRISYALEQAAETFDGRAVIAKYNCDEASDKAAQYGVRGIPTVIAFKKGEVIDQRTGACDQATLDAFIEKNL